MKRSIRLAVILVVGWCALSSAVPLHDREHVADKHVVVAEWKTFYSKAGWLIKYPRTWRPGSCRSCPDPTHPEAMVTFRNPLTKEMLILERLADLPQGRAVDQWLVEVATGANLNPQVSKQWTTIGGERALKVVTRDPDGQESETVYVVHGSLVLSCFVTKGTSSYRLCQLMMSTLRFTGQH